MAIQLMNLSRIDLNPPFMIILIELQVAWSPLLQHDAGHIWLRRLIVRTARDVSGGDR